MTTSQKIVSAVVGLWLVALTGFAFVQGAPHGSQIAEGGLSPVTDFQQGVWWFKNQLYIGKTQQFTVSSSGAVTIGTGNTAVAGLNWSKCSLIASTYTVAASTTVPMDCAVTNAVSTDFVLAQFGTTTLAVSGGWRITGVSASSTPGYDTLQVRNDTGASNVIPSQLASSTKVLNLR